MSSSDDFFSSELSSPPKQTANLKARGSTRTRAQQQRPPPPPPPKRAGAPSATRSARESSSASHVTVSAGATTGAGITASRRTAPTMSRPIGTYYGASASSSPSTTSSSQSFPPTKTTVAATTGTHANFYGTNTSASTTSATAPAPSSEGWDWGATALSTATSNSVPAVQAAESTGSRAASIGKAPTPTPTHAANTSIMYSQWAAPQNKTGEAIEPESNAADWYSAPSNDGNNNSFYTQPPPSVTQEQHFHQHQHFLSGSMDLAVPTSSGHPQQTQHQVQEQMQPRTFVPTANSSGDLASQQQLMMADEAPLLEELGINIPHILVKTKAVILPFTKSTKTMDPAVICHDADLAGPIAFCLLLGAEMVLAGKLQFGYIYGFGVFGCLSMALVVNLMSPSGSVSVWTVASVLGYALIPVNVLAAVKLLFINLLKLQTFGRLLGLLTVGWSTTASTRLLEVGCGLREQRYLIAYPIALLYSAFVLITIF